MRKTSFALMIGLMLVLNSGLASATSGATQKALQNCAICHGMDGNNTSPNFPRLAAQQASYMEEQLKAFRNKTRADADAQDYMWGWAAPLSDETIKELAAYFAAQKPVSGKAGNPELTAKGKHIYEDGVATRNILACATCHGPNAEGAAPFPRLAGQHAAYLKKQLKVFYTGQRPAAVAMHAIVAALTPDDIEAIAVFLQSK